MMGFPETKLPSIVNMYAGENISQSSGSTMDLLCLAKPESSSPLNKNKNHRMGGLLHLHESSRIRGCLTQHGPEMEV
jgi:hypothetical protein